jgi:hypothetical protein
MSLNLLIERVAKLPYDYPPGTEAVQLKNVPTEQQEKVARLASEVTPICDVGLYELLRDFLMHKQTRGSSVEQKLYAEMNVSALFTRLLRNRPISFWSTSDRFILATTVADRKLQSGQWGGFEEVGGSEECAPLNLEKYLSFRRSFLSPYPPSS